jgi:hypothetical protein
MAPTVHRTLCYRTEIANADDAAADHMGSRVSQFLSAGSQQSASAAGR